MIDEFGHEVFERVYRGHFQFDIVNDQLFRKQAGVWKHVLSPKDRSIVAKELHEVFGHCGVNKLIQIMRQYYYIPDLLGTCTRVVASCLACQKVKKQP